MTTKKSASFLVLSALVFAAGCSSSSSPSTAGGGDGGGGGGGGSDVCTKVPKADIQAVLANPITNVGDNSSLQNCTYSYSTGTMSIEWNEDADMSLYNSGATGTKHPVSGVGDEAYWTQTVPGHNTPAFAAHKGSITCVPQPPEPPDSTLKVTNLTDSSFDVSDADADAFAQLLGKICNDVFAAQ